MRQKRRFESTELVIPVDYFRGSLFIQRKFAWMSHTNER